MSASHEIIVVGAGVLGLCTAVELTRRGHDVRVIDPGGQNASSVAAGMIAPALESALDDVSPRRAALLRDAKAQWARFIPADRPGGTPLHLRLVPAIWAGGDASAVRDRLQALGFEATLADDLVFVPDDIQIDAESALATLRQRLMRPVIQSMVETVTASDDGWQVATQTETLTAHTVVLATGAARSIDGLPDPVAVLVDRIIPIRGQIGRARDLRLETVVRRADVYLAPAQDAAFIGATMDMGRRDMGVDVIASIRLCAAAASLAGQPIEGEVEWRVGIRGTTPDGLPMAGPSGVSGLHLALAPRRNGWLLGPMVAGIVADGIEGRVPDSHAAALDPLRFNRPAG